MYHLVQKYAFLPPNPPSYAASNVNFIPKSHGQIPYLLYLASGDHPLENKYTILFTHGNAEDLGQLHHWMSYVNKQLDVNVLAYDYAGYGYNGEVGVCSETSCYDDIDTVYMWLIFEKMVPPQKLILWGRSLGTGPTVHMAAKLSKNKTTSLIGVILQSPLLSAVKVGMPAIAWIPYTDIFCNYAKISKINVPIFILHSDNDAVVPFTHGLALADKCNSLWKFWTVKGAGHNHIEAFYRDDYIAYLTDFLKHITEEQSKPVMPTVNKPHGWCSHSCSC